MKLVKDNKYSLIEDRSELEKAQWHMDRSYICLGRIKKFLEEWQSAFCRRPIVESCSAGIEFFEFLSQVTISEYINPDAIRLTLYGVVIEVKRDWSVHPLYIELNVE